MKMAAAVSREKSVLSNKQHHVTSFKFLMLKGTAMTSSDLMYVIAFLYNETRTVWMKLK